MKRKPELILAAGFVVLNLVAPLVFGERYPFTISPMFCDQPSEYCIYEVESADGRSLDPEPFGLHLVYDGNPPGLGMGVQACPTLHGFGAVASPAEVEQHVRQCLRQMPDVDSVRVRQIHVFSADHRLQTAVRELEIHQGPSIPQPEGAGH